MAQYKCKKCGGGLRVNQSRTAAMCPNCGAKYTLTRSSSAAAAGASASASKKAQASRGAHSHSAQSRSRSGSRRRKNNNRMPLLIAALVLCLLLFASVFVFVGCFANNGGGGKPDDTEGSVTTGGETTPDTPEETAEQTEAETTAPETVPETQAPPAYTPTFTADLSEYEMYMDPSGDQQDAYLVLVNPWNPLTANDVPKDLVNVKSTRKDGRATQQLREYAARALEALMLEAEACGIIKTNTPSGYPLSVMSAYRSYSYQNELFNRYVNQEMANKGLSREAAEAIVVTYSCRAGTSEHQSGLCVDMHTHPSANVNFKNETEAKWLAENCHKFGFILRFPEDKTDITGITYEPWHFRYVGRYHATKMKDLGMCLEEYTEYLKNS